MTPNHTVNGIAQGQPCYLVRDGNPHAPVHCPSAVILTVPAGFGSEPVVWHEGQTYTAREVFATEEAARAHALTDAKWLRDIYASQSARMAIVVRELEAPK